MRRLIFCLPLLIAGCAKDYVDFGDDAFEREYWEEAIEQYEMALPRETAPDVVQRIKENLAVARGRASAQHAENARNAMAAKDFDRAIAEAEIAHKFKPAADTAALLAQARDQKANVYYLRGKAELELGEIDRALASLAEAVQVNPSNGEYVKALQDAKRLRFETVASAEKRAEEGFAKRDWRAAVKAYDELLKWKDDSEARRKSEFAKAMDKAEGALDVDAAVALPFLQKAATFGFHKEYVAQLLDENTPADWEVTFHDATVLPFKPTSNMPWDGTGGVVAGASDLVTRLAELTGDAEVRLAKAAQEIIKFTPPGSAAPDCQLKIVGFGEPVESAVRRDEYRPTFGTTMKVSKRSKRDKTVLIITVSDQDDAFSEPVGTYEMKLGDLLRQEGSRVQIYVGDDKKFRFGGVYGMKISVRKLQK